MIDPSWTCWFICSNFPRIPVSLYSVHRKGSLKILGIMMRGDQGVPELFTCAQSTHSTWELNCDLDKCKEAREVTVIDGVAESDSKVKVMLLRTNSMVRLVTFSGSLNPSRENVESWYNRTS